MSMDDTKPAPAPSEDRRRPKSTGLYVVSWSILAGCVIFALVVIYSQR
jgi:hypothetical protein